MLRRELVDMVAAHETSGGQQLTGREISRRIQAVMVRQRVQNRLMLQIRKKIRIRQERVLMKWGKF